MSVKLKLCRQCGGEPKVNDYDASIECMICEYEEGDSAQWNKDRHITKADIDVHLSKQGLVAIDKEFLSVVERLRDDLLMRAELDSDEVMVVNVSSSIWTRFKAMIAAYKEQEL